MSQKPDIVLDVKGMLCPMHIMKTKRAVDNMLPGQVIEVIGSDAALKTDIPKLCIRLSLELIDSAEEKGIFRFRIRK